MARKRHKPEAIVAKLQNKLMLLAARNQPIVKTAKTLGKAAFCPGMPKARPYPAWPARGRK